VSVDPTERRTRSVVLIILGSVVGLIGLALLAGGGTVLWADQTQRDSSGYFTSASHRVATGSYAVTHEGVSLRHLPGFVKDGKYFRARIAAHGDRPLFVGIARQSDVRAYLANVAHANLREYDVGTSDQRYDQVGGVARPARPASRHIWVASRIGSAPLEFRLREGKWSVVLMNADASKGVRADVKLGAKVGYLGRATAALFAFGVALVALAVFLIVRGVRRRDGGEPVGASSQGVPSPASPARPAGSYPAALAARLDEPLSRGLWLVKWLLLIPHVIVLAFLWLAFTILTVIAWFAVVFTGHYPRGIFDFNVGVLRWSWRVTYYGYGALGTDRYPPFSLAAEPDYPATLAVVYPGEQSRLSAFGRLVLAFPQLLIIGVFVGGGAYWGWHFASPWSGLIGLLVVIAGVALLFTGRYPRGLFDLIVGLNRWVLRVVAYASLLTDEYPPFRFDGGGDEPRPAPSAPAPAPAHL
jgi:uncharacterized protein DUF4389